MSESTFCTLLCACVGGGFRDDKHAGSMIPISVWREKVGASPRASKSNEITNLSHSLVQIVVNFIREADFPLTELRQLVPLGT